MNIDRNSNQIAYWLLTGAFLVVLMIVIGCITRLTHSGLSMVTWKPVTGTLPPLSEADWQAQFSLYKQSPEFLKVNHHFTLNDFKQIFWWEYIHRLLGRIIGMVFLIPFFYFLITKKLKDKQLTINLSIIFLLGVFQAFIGWYMVKSGLVNNPSVSHLRLALHLSTALLLFGAIFYTTLKLLIPKKINLKHSKGHKTLFLITFSLLSIQIVYGAFVAGLKAGLFYNTFPKMNGYWIPPSLFNNFVGVGQLVNNPIWVQFIHRWTAIAVFISFIFLIIKLKKIAVTKLEQNTLHILLGTLIIQVLLGVLTLLFSVPVVMGVLHQLGAVLLLSSFIWVVYLFNGNTKLLVKK